MRANQIAEYNKSKGFNLVYVFLLLAAFYLFMVINPYITLHSIAGKALLGAVLMAGGFIGILWLLSAKRIYLSGITKTIVIVSLLVFIVGILTIPVSWLHFNVIYPVYIIGDAVAILWLCFAVAIFGSIKNQNKIQFRTIYRLYLFFAIILLLHWIVTWVYYKSFHTPDYMIFALIFSGAIGYFAFRQKQLHIIIIYSFLFIIFLVITFFGWARNAFFGYIGCFVITFLTISKLSSVKSWIYVFCILLFAGILHINFLAAYLPSTRLYEAVSSPYGLGGESVYHRFCEAANALHNMFYLWPSIVTGFGHGAVYRYYPGVSDLVSSMILNLTQEGFIHNIHIGPVLLLFRYGILGLILYILFIAILIKGFFFGKRLYNQISSCKLKADYFAVKLFYMNYFIYFLFLLRFHLANSLINPFFALSLAITAMFISRPNLLRDTHLQYHET